MIEIVHSNVTITARPFSKAKNIIKHEIRIKKTKQIQKVLLAKRILSHQ